MQEPDADRPARPALRRDRRERSGRDAGGDATGARLKVGSLFGAAAPSPVASGEQDGEAPTLLVVCTGNICRSPLGELLLRDRLAPLGVHVHSAGTHALVGFAMQTQSQRIALEHGVSPQDAASHRARQVTEPMLRRADLTLTMTRSQRRGVVEKAPRALRRAFPVREFAALAELVPDVDLREAAEAAVAATGADTLRTRLAGAISCVSARRGLVPLDTDADDVIDPYRRPADVYDESAAQLLPAIDEVIRVVSAVLPAPRS